MAGILLVIVLTLSLCSCTRAAEPPNGTPVSLRVEYLTRPLGLDTPKPRLYWRVYDMRRGARQAAYRVQVASSIERLQKGQPDLWDSGRVNSPEQAHIVYAGKPLVAGQRVWWRVASWSALGGEPRWSEPEYWGMGLFFQRVPQARWISLPPAGVRDISPHNGYHSQQTDNPEDPKWVGVDLGEPRPIDAVRLYPARPFDWVRDEPGFSYPLRFRIEVDDSPQFANPRVVADFTQNDVPNPGRRAQTYRFEAVRARAVRVYCTRLRHHDGARYQLALAEMQVLQGSQVVSQGAAGVALDSLEVLRPSGWSLKYLTDGRTRPEKGTADLPLSPPPAMRTEFILPAAPRRAVLSFTALGVVEMRLNGQRAHESILAPESTDYHLRVQYQTVDVTGLLKKGANALAAQLGDGWYCGFYGLHGRRQWGVYPELLAELRAEMPDGRIITVATGPNWRATDEGPVRHADILDGQHEDRTREMPGWDQPGFDQSSWKSVTVTHRPARLLVAQPNEPIQVTRVQKPKQVTEPAPGVLIFDMGQNMVGHVRLKLTGPRGTQVTVRHGEMLNDDGTLYTANLRAAQQTDKVTLNGNPTVFEPRLTYHGFRYVEVTGWKEPVTLQDVEGMVCHSAAPDTGTFACSNPMLTQLWSNTLWTQRANLMSIPTDCPQRDERLGWTGDIQTFAQTAIFNMDLGAFFTKWLRDVRDSQTEEGAMPEVAPNPEQRRGPFTGAPGWGDVGTVLPWICWVNYADRQMLADQYDAAKRWVDYIHKHNPDLIWRNRRGSDYGDWLHGDTLIYEGWPRQGGEVPKEQMATAFFAHSTDLLARMARVLGKQDDARIYTDLYARIREAYNAAYLKSDGALQANTQGGYAFGLAFDLIPDALRPAALQHAIDNIERYGYRLSTGFNSTTRMVMELTRGGQNDLAWRLVQNTVFPSWGYMIENGATTIWERWDGYVKGRGFQNPGMNSFNHWAFGSITEWLYRHALGLNPDPANPGWRKFLVAPKPGGGVTWAQGTYRSLYGPIFCSWAIRDGRIELQLSVPPGAEAEIHLPTSRPTALRESGKPVSDVAGISVLPSGEDLARVRVAAGQYVFSAPE